MSRAAATAAVAAAARGGLACWKNSLCAAGAQAWRAGNCAHKLPRHTSRCSGNLLVRHFGNSTNDSTDPGDSYPAQITTPRMRMTKPEQYLQTREPRNTLNLRRVLVVTKLSRYEHERRRFPHLSEEVFRITLEERGAMYSSLKQRHDLHHEYVQNMLMSFKDHGCQVKLVCITDYKPSDLDGVDAVISAGGDGTFLSSSALITTRRIPLIGINTDPQRSHGHLCLHDNHVPVPIDEALDRLHRGDFKWLLRQRIRITMVDEKTRSRTVLPRFPLNDCLFCDWDAAHAVYYQMQIDADPNKSERQKSSGVLVCTGTGSTAWTYAMNKMSEGDLEHLFANIRAQLSEGKSNEFSRAVEGMDLTRLANAFNDRVTFDPTDHRLQFTVREPIVNGIFKADRRRGLCEKLSLRSRSPHGRVVVDGTVSYDWKDGVTAELQIFPEDALLSLAF